MKTTSSFVFLSFCVMLLSGCGQVEIPADAPPEETIVVPTLNSDPTADPTQKNSDQDEETSENSEIIACTEEKQALSEALELNTTALQACETEKKRLSTTVQNLSQPINEATKYGPFVNFYLENKDLAEFRFSTCGFMGNFRGLAWFPDFIAALEDAAIPFGTRTVTADDLSGGCFSAEGNMAFFLGADDGETLSEFHLFKFLPESNQLQEAFLVDGPCEVCPNKVGKRNGSYLSLSGNNGSQTVLFRYYYADNILKREE